jgi:hypothetical protein
MQANADSRRLSGWTRRIYLLCVCLMLSPLQLRAQSPSPNNGSTAHAALHINVTVVPVATSFNSKPADEVQGVTFNFGLDRAALHNALERVVTHIEIEAAQTTALPVITQTASELRRPGTRSKTAVLETVTFVSR